MEVNSPAGELADPARLVDVERLLAGYHDERPDPSIDGQRVAFGTSGHRGSSLTASFTESHVLAIAEAICRYRASQGIHGPLFLGRDTHALSEPAFRTTLEVLAAHGVDVLIDADGGYTPTPVISHEIVNHNRQQRGVQADGIVLTPSHNPPEDGGFKYNPPTAGPAATDVTAWIEQEANRLLEAGLEPVRRLPFEQAAHAATTHRHDYVSAYVDELVAVIDLDLIRGSGLRLAVDPLGGSSLAFWEAIGERHDLDLTIVNDTIDPTFRFVPVDWDGKIRMDCSSPYPMARLAALKDDFDIAFGNDPDADRHGVVTPAAGLLNPNHYLAACVAYLFGGDRAWSPSVGVGKTVVTSSIIDRVANQLNRRVIEVPVGFKWFVDGLLDGTLGFAGEESAGASFLRRDGSSWATDKDGLIACLVAAEMTARRGIDPGRIYEALTDRLGAPEYRRVDVSATPEQKAALAHLSGEGVTVAELAGEPIRELLSSAPGNGAPIGGLKVVAEHGWFAARPSGTEDVYKIYAESFLGAEHLERILEEARNIVQSSLTRP
ncbi:MAG: phosphoglucomutase (alpha-D-glucose-1,6-bisphosphate-dependent) [Actinomycetota bacterium]|nr:phosphoglucomutase (alpha-D-glucose-1,6-bisphosphate-dependent) [Actinomycetota bacterium]